MLWLWFLQGLGHLLKKHHLVIGSQILIGIGAAVFPPAITAITLGLVGRRQLDRRVGCNETFNHSGNLLAATLAALIGQFIAQEGIFFLVGIMAIASAYSVLRIREKEIDHELARGDGLEEEKQGNRTGRPKNKYEGILQLLSDRRLLIFVGTVVLFHFANAAMLPLVGQVLALRKGSSPALSMSACILLAQIVQILLGILIGRWG